MWHSFWIINTDTNKKKEEAEEPGTHRQYAWNLHWRDGIRRAPCLGKLWLEEEQEGHSGMRSNRSKRRRGWQRWSSHRWDRDNEMRLM